MLSRSLRASLIDAQSILPPTYLLPIRARLATISNTVEPSDIPEPLLRSSKVNSKQRTARPTSAQDRVKRELQHEAQVKRTAALPSPSQTQTPLDDSVKELLPHLHAQRPHYIRAHIHGFPFLLTEGDKLKLPFLLKNVETGSTIRLNRASTIGSRDFTLQSAPDIRGTRDGPKVRRYLDEDLFVCRAVVMGVETEPMRTMEKTKRRQRHTKYVESKHRYTMLRISEVKIHSLQEYEEVREKRAQGLLEEPVDEAIEEVEDGEGEAMSVKANPSAVQQVETADNVRAVS